MKTKQLNDWLQVMASINRHGRAFWKNSRIVYTPEFAALIDGGMDGRATGLGVGMLKLTGEGLTGDSPTE